MFPDSGPLRRFPLSARLLLAAALVTQATAAPQLTELNYQSSVDGEPLTSRLYLPSGLDPSGAEVPLVCYLHGAGGVGAFPSVMQDLLEERGWIGVAPDGRVLDTSSSACSWPFSPAYFNSPDPAVGPGEQDILDAIDAASTLHPVDAERVYLAGFSYGGRGAYLIGLKNPDRFAAIAPMGAPTDMYEIDVRRPDSEGCRLLLLGGVPGDSDEIDTRFTTTSARFLLENAYHLPVFHGHGRFDTVASNTPTEAPYLHGWHVTVATGWDACHSPSLCFGHTPTLSELAARHPGAYPFAYQFTPVPHVVDARWLTGTPMAQGLFGTEDPNAPGQLLGIFDFFESHSRVHSPETVVFKTYETEHRKAYWLELLSATPNQDLPAAVRATRNLTTNTLSVELVRAADLRIQLPEAQLALAPDQALHVQLATLQEAVYDPALDASGENWQPTLTLDAGQDLVGASVYLDGAPLPAPLLSLENGALTIGPLDISQPRSLAVHPFRRICASLPNSAGTAASLLPVGSTSLQANDLSFTVGAAAPNQFGLGFYGFANADLPLADGRLCVAAPLYRLPDVILLDAAAQGSLPLDLAAPPANSGPGTITAGVSVTFQFWFRDPAGTLGSNTSEAVELAFQ